MLIALWVNITVRGINVISKILRMRKPLRDLVFVHWLLALPQWIYLRLHGMLPQSALLKEAREWMTTGFILIATRPDRSVRSDG